MTSDQRAIGFLILLGVAGAAVRMVSASRSAPGALVYHPSSAAGPRPSFDSIAARASRMARPLRPGETVDLDVASVEEIGRLPRVGPGVAARIVADRDAHGPFGSLEGLDRVSGIGPSLLRTLEPLVRFSGTPISTDLDLDHRVTLNTATVQELDQLPGIGPATARAIVADRNQRGPYSRLEDLARVPGIRSAVIKGLQDRVRVP